MTALVFFVAAVWLAYGSWLNYIRPQEFDLKAYERYQEQVTQCRALRTSEARYDCVAQSLIGRDRVNFGTAMVVFLPPLLLILGHYVWMEVRANMREREHARHAEEVARQQLSRFRRELREERAAALARVQAQADGTASADVTKIAKSLPPRGTPPLAGADPSARTPKRA